MDKDYLKDFKKRWQERAKEIKTKYFDNNQIYRIKMSFIEELPSILIRCKTEDKLFELKKISNDLDLALEIAFSNYRTEKLKNQSFWSFSLFGNYLKKLPQSKLK